MDKHVSISEAKNRLPALVHDIEHGSAVQLTRHGKPVAVLISILQYKKLISRPKNFWATLSAFRDSADESALLSSDDDFFDHRAQSPGRSVNFEK
jgi:prevent-host-death family protein